MKIKKIFMNVFPLLFIMGMGALIAHLFRTDEYVFAGMAIIIVIITTWLAVRRETK